jgi:hypothetical protein
MDPRVVLLDRLVRALTPTRRWLRPISIVCAVTGTALAVLGLFNGGTPAPAILLILLAGGLGLMAKGHVLASGGGLARGDGPTPGDGLARGD